YITKIRVIPPANIEAPPNSFYLLRQSLSNPNHFSPDDFLCSAANSWIAPIQNALSPVQTPNMAHMVRRSCLADAVSVILYAFLPYRAPSNRRGVFLAYFAGGPYNKSISQKWEVCAWRYRSRANIR